MARTASCFVEELFRESLCSGYYGLPVGRNACLAAGADQSDPVTNASPAMASSDSVTRFPERRPNSTKKPSVRGQHTPRGWVLKSIT